MKTSLLFLFFVSLSTSAFSQTLVDGNYQGGAEYCGVSIATDVATKVTTLKIINNPLSGLRCVEDSTKSAELKFIRKDGFYVSENVEELCLKTGCFPEVKARYLVMTKNDKSFYIVRRIEIVPEYIKNRMKTIYDIQIGTLLKTGDLSFANTLQNIEGNLFSGAAQAKFEFTDSYDYGMYNASVGLQWETRYEKHSCADNRVWSMKVARSFCRKVYTNCDDVNLTAEPPGYEGAACRVTSFVRGSN